jgi:hypothetical protein
MNKPAKAVVTRQQDLNTYAELWHASACVLRVGKAEPVASSWQFLSSLVLTAFAFEAYMNHVGEKVLAANWESSEHLPPSDKLDMICAALNVTLPGTKGERPQQTIVQLFKFRNTLAHARTETLEETKRLDAGKVDDDFGRRLSTQWQRLIHTSDFAERAREDVEAVLTRVHDARPDPEEWRFGAFGFGSGSATLEAT